MSRDIDNKLQMELEWRVGCWTSKMSEVRVESRVLKCLVLVMTEHCIKFYNEFDLLPSVKFQCYTEVTVTLCCYL